MTHEQKIKLLTPWARIRSVSGWIDKTSTNTVFPFWHTVSDTTLPHIKHLYHVKSVEAFLSDLEFLLKHFQPISLEDSLSDQAQTKEKTMLLSFDDGLVEVYDIIAPILKQKGIPAIFFINPPFVGDADIFYRYEISSLISELEKQKGISASEKRSLLSLSFHDKKQLNEAWEKAELSKAEIIGKNRIYMSKEEIVSLKKQGFEIGAHSMTHARFSDLSIDKQIEEVKESVNEIQHLAQPKYHSFAFPFSDDGVSKQTLGNIHKEANLDCSFGTSGIGQIDKVKHVQRIPMEHKQCFSASRIMHAELMAYWLKQKRQKS